MTVKALLLAAGSSSRLGEAKQLVSYEGRSLLRRSAEMLLASGCDSVIVVLGADAERLLLELEALPVTICHNPSWQTGIASSIAAGLRHSADPDAVLIALCDQPLITVEHYRELVRVFQAEGKPAVAALYKSGPGVPALFARELFPRLLALQGDVGARRLLIELRDQVAFYPLPQAAVDVDTPQDLQALCSVRRDPSEDASSERDGA